MDSTILKTDLRDALSNYGAHSAFEDSAEEKYSHWFPQVALCNPLKSLRTDLRKFPQFEDTQGLSIILCNWPQNFILNGHD